MPFAEIVWAEVDCFGAERSLGLGVAVALGLAETLAAGVDVG